MGGGYFYFIKWKQGLLIADRAIQSSISAQAINKAGYYTGSKYRLLTEDEFNAAMTDDFGGNFKFSTNPQTTFYTTNGINLGDIANYYYNGVYNVHSVSFQSVKRQRVYGYISNQNFSVSNISNFSGYYDMVLNGNTTYLSYLFLPCMEYVDSSKSTNIFY